MSCLGFSKPLLPTNEAWTKLTSRVRTNFSKIKPSKSLNRLATGFQTVVVRRRPRRSRSAYHVCVDKIQTTKRSSSSSTLHNHQCFAPIYVDELYSQPLQLRLEKKVEPAAENKGVLMKKKKEKAGKSDMFVAPPSSSSRVVEDQIGGVDLRAEMFIRKFKEEKKLERQRSFEEYQEMLARGV
ncbi:hypothetical protein Cni_G18375 [Canna indica]|uniref:Uncharacterized protein n=1 Tax=Canna indica TaxID=4628 RepID=A0AAQ3KKS1_9LILI|nr:hypothetical protein Cni_G18375 [Canna indica]